MIKKITIFYVDNTFEDIDADYFNLNVLCEDTSTKSIKEILIYFTNGKYTKIVNSSNVLTYPPGVRKVDDVGQTGPVKEFPWDTPRWPSGSWSDPTKIVD